MVYDTMASPLGEILIARDDEGLRRVDFTEGSNPHPRGKDWRPAPRDNLLAEARRQIAAWFEGGLKRFDLPLAAEGTAFQKRVWQALTTIPYGTTWSYKQLATAIGNPAACRAVGGANGRNPISIIVP